jgi:hypothetical protein
MRKTATPRALNGGATCVAGHEASCRPMRSEGWDLAFRRGPAAAGHGSHISELRRLAEDEGSRVVL